MAMTEFAMHLAWVAGGRLKRDSGAVSHHCYPFEVVIKFTNQWIILVLVKGGRDYISPLEGNIYLVYKWYILPIG